MASVHCVGLKIPGRHGPRAETPGPRLRASAASRSRASARLCRFHASGLPFDGADLAEAPHVAWLPVETGSEERRGARDGRFDGYPARPEGEHVHVVVLDSLARGIRVVA